MSEVFQQGHIVRWNSERCVQEGCDARYTGTVITYIPPNSIPQEIYPPLRDLLSNLDRLGSGKAGASTNKRVLVRVSQKNKRGDLLPGCFYGPELSALTLVGGTPFHTLRELVEHLETIPSDPEGVVRIMHRIFVANSVEHVCYSGALAYQAKAFEPHYWIQLPGDAVIDFRLKLYMGESAPNGIFWPEDERVVYHGQPLDMRIISDSEFTSHLIPVITQRANSEPSS